ncbi:hypothetical protein PsorP6_004122 [Peronosclerospora sorghi]|uniref:Uncharacterized protein n=1 Tax=Peronosclerospora sorghi TaxID=230839 RepID=A0ACC0VMM3_9STRA|nr:hypothetical protein PsorP6_004122 [Peronosclerospora sorghi]
MMDSSWQETLASETHDAKKEWMALERRYHLKQNSVDLVTQDKHVSLFLSLSDPELPVRFRGQVELQMTLPMNYPMDAVQVDFSQWSNRLSEKQVKVLNEAMQARAQQIRGDFLLRKLLTWIDNNFWRVVAPYEEDPKHEIQESVVELEKSAQREMPKTTEKRRKRLCRYFVRGNCREHEECKFLHQMKNLAKERKGSVVRNADVPRSPQTAKPVSATSKSKKKSGARMCKFFAQGKCRDGEKCKFSHEATSDNIDSPKHNPKNPRAVIVELGAQIRDPIKTTEAEVVAASYYVENRRGNEWSKAQQRALDMALRKFPASMDKEKRWTSIANKVDGRSLNECIDRFKALCEIVRREVDPVTTIEQMKNEQEKITESTEIEEHVQNSRIIPAENRVKIATEPAVKGTQICLEDLFLHEVGTLVAHRLVCQVQCSNCPLKFDATLSLNSVEIQKWCPRCSVLQHVLMSPVFAHSHDNVLAYVDTDNCYIVDVLPTDVLATCLKCGCEALLERLMPRQRLEQACFSCHVKLAVSAKRFLAQHLSGSIVKRSSSPNGTEAKAIKKGAKHADSSFVVGQPLPRNGTCNHYKHSLRWFRFQCCGKAFPCDVCHDSSECLEANLGKFASRVICGLCSKEQSSTIKECSCGNDFTKKKSTTSHWEGGTGCRNSLQMSRWDKQKYRGQNKTESKKLKRVGLEAKRRREKANVNANAEQ